MTSVEQGWHEAWSDLLAKAHTASGKTTVVSGGTITAEEARAGQARIAKSRSRTMMHNKHASPLKSSEVIVDGREGHAQERGGAHHKTGT